MPVRKKMPQNGTHKLLLLLTLIAGVAFINRFGLAVVPLGYRCSTAFVPLGGWGVRAWSGYVTHGDRVNPGEKNCQNSRDS